MSDFSKEAKPRKRHRYNSNNNNNNTYNNNSTFNNNNNSNNNRNSNRNRPNNSQNHRQNQYQNARHATEVSSSTVTSTTTPAQGQVREIPGFYYDTEKKKYFAITSTHLVNPQHAYIRHTIAENEKQKPVLQPITSATKKRTLLGGRLDRTPYRHLTWMLDDRQLGMAGSPKRQLCDLHSKLVRQWKRNKDREPFIPWSAQNYSPHMHIENNTDELPAKNLYMGMTDGSLYRYTKSSSDLDRLNMAYLWRRIGIELGSEVTSVYKTKQDGLLMSSYLGNMAKSGTFKIQKEGDRLFDEPKNVFVYTPRLSNVWTSEYSESNGKIALGADQRIVVIHDWRQQQPQHRQQHVVSRTAQEGHHQGVQEGIQQLWTGSDVFSIAIDSLGGGGGGGGGQNVIYGGLRNGTVKVFDLNQPASTIPSNAAAFKSLQKEIEESGGGGGPSSILNGIGHKESSVICLKRISDHLLVTQANNGEIAMWDTRFVGGQGSPSTAGAGTGTRVRTRTGTIIGEPVIRFRERLSDQFSNSRLDISADGQLLVAENLEDQVSIWSMRTGDRIKDMKMEGGVGGGGNEGGGGERRRVSCVRFSDEQATGIHVAVSGRVQCWGWGNSQD